MRNRSHGTSLESRLDILVVPLRGEASKGGTSSISAPFIPQFEALTGKPWPVNIEGGWGLGSHDLGQYTLQGYSPSSANTASEHGPRYPTYPPI
jgi:hypothetical protein